MAAVTPPRSSHHHHEPLFYPVDSTPTFGTSPCRQPSFSFPDLDYKMKMMQLTLHFQAASTTGTSYRQSPAGRHSTGSFSRPAEKSTPAITVSHQPKILAVEPKYRPVNAVKPGCSNPSNDVQVSVKSATLPIVPQQTKVNRLVRLFEDSSGTTVVSTKSHVPRAEPVKQLQIKALIKVKPTTVVQASVKPVQKVKPEEPPKLGNEIAREVGKVSPLIQTQKIVIKSPEPAKEYSSLVDDEVIKDVLRQRRKVKELCKFFEHQAKY